MVVFRFEIFFGVDLVFRFEIFFGMGSVVAQLLPKIVCVKCPKHTPPFCAKQKTDIFFKKKKKKY